METPPNMATSDKEKQTWILQTCPEPGCTVVIRSLPGYTVERCKWHQGGNAYNSKQIKHTIGTGELISKEEFGQDLFDAIQVQSEIRSCYRQAALERTKERKKRADDLELHAVELQKHLEAILRKKTIGTDDLRRLLAIT